MITPFEITPWFSTPFFSSSNWLQRFNTASESKTYRQIKQNPYLISRLTQKSVLKHCSAAWGEGHVIQSMKPGCVRFRGLNLNYEGKQRKGILTVGDDTWQRLDKAFTQYVPGRVKYSGREWLGIGLTIYMIPIMPTVEKLLFNLTMDCRCCCHNQIMSIYFPCL